MLPIKNELFPVERQICDGHLGFFFCLNLMNGDGKTLLPLKCFNKHVVVVFFIDAVLHVRPSDVFPPRL